MVNDWLYGHGDAAMQVGHVVSARAGNEGMTGHRGPLYPGQYVDADVLGRELTARGFAPDDVRAVYKASKGGPLPRHLRPTRDRLDLALAELARQGGSLRRLATVLGLNPRMLQKAAQRGRRAARR